MVKIFLFFSDFGFGYLRVWPILSVFTLLGRLI